MTYDEALARLLARTAGYDPNDVSALTGKPIWHSFNMPASVFLDAHAAAVAPTPEVAAPNEPPKGVLLDEDTFKLVHDVVRVMVQALPPTGRGAHTHKALAAKRALKLLEEKII